jgi:NAD(P)-dependent dehydrogenase (short-subunit alcohol dehydrogenase family)
MTWTVEGKTALITGGNSGIGRETAIALARMGARVTVTARDPERGAAAARDIATAAGAEVEVMPLDLASFASIRSFAADFLGRHNGLHVLVNNAGVILSQRTTTAEGFETTFGVNHLGHFLLTDLLLDRIKASAPARIINVRPGPQRFARASADDLRPTRLRRGKAYARSSSRTSTSR